ncbi:MAG: DUF1345 domain-containing protein [Kineosporiaceae bacterium]
MTSGTARPVRSRRRPGAATRVKALLLTDSGRVWGATLVSSAAFFAIVLSFGYPRSWPPTLDIADALLLAWVLWSVPYLVLTLVAFRRITPRRIGGLERLRLSQRRRGGLPAWLLGSRGYQGLVLALQASAYALLGAAFVLPGARDAPSRLDGVLSAVIAFAAVVAAWLTAQVAYANHYAHRYFLGAPDRGGLEFPGGQPPDYLDFLYFATAVGSTFGTTDVTVTGRGMRRSVTWHGLYSFGFNTGIVAVTISYLAGG